MFMVMGVHLGGGQASWERRSGGVEKFCYAKKGGTGVPEEVGSEKLI